MATLGETPQKRHRHDGGDVPHGTDAHEGITRAIQYLLGMWIVGSAAVVIYALGLAATR